MEIIVAILTAALIYNSVVLHRQLRELRLEVENLSRRIDSTKQARFKTSTTSSGTPRVDSRGRTTRRDTSDIPARGGRISKLTKKVDAHVSLDSDSRLPEHP